MNVESCPDVTKWKAFLDETLAAEDAQQLESHLETCDRCQQVLQNAAAGNETWEGTATRLAEADEQKEQLSSSGHLRDVMQELKDGSATAGSWTVSPKSLTFLQPVDDANLLGRIGAYDVIEIIGHGGMGIVLKAWDPSLRRVVAIKVLAGHLANSGAARRRFVREAQAAAAVTHDHVVAIHAVEESHDPPFIVMQFIEGKTVQQRLDMTGALDVREVLRIGQQTALGLAAAHRQGIVHRDIKPANILLENGVERVRITDFGLARAIDDASMTQSGVVAGTPLFMAPEQAQGQPVDHRSDLFSLGSVLYALCTARAPFRSSTMMGVIRRVCDDEARPIREINPDIPDWLCGIIERLLRKNPSDRFSSAEEVAELLAACLAHVQHPLSVPLPALAESFAGRREDETVEKRDAAPVENPPESIPNPVPSEGRTPTVENRSNGQPADLNSDEVKSLLKWPVRLTIITALLNTTFFLFVSLYFFAAGGAVPSGGALTGLFFAIPVIALLLAVVGAVRVSRLQSVSWGLAAGTIIMVIGPAYPLGWPVGIWLLWVLGRADVRQAFRADARRYQNLTTPSELDSTERVLARIVSITAIVALTMFVPVLGFLSSGMEWFKDATEEKIYFFAGFAVTLMGLGALFRFGFGVGRRRATTEEASAFRRQLRSPAHWIGTLVSVAAWMVMWMDYSGQIYSPGLEAAVLPICVLAMITLSVIVLIRRIRNAKLANGEDDERYVPVGRWPVGLIGILLPATLLWTQWHRDLGYVTLQADSADVTIQFHRVGDSQPGTRFGGTTKFRLAAGKYKWTVSEYGLVGDSIANGLVEVTPGTKTEIQIEALGDQAVDKVAGRWKCKSYAIDWAADSLFPLKVEEVTERVPALEASLPSWTRKPDWVEFTNDHATFHYASEPKTLSFLWAYNVKNSPKTLSLTGQTDKAPIDEDIAMGIWAVGRNSLVLNLEPFGNHCGLKFHSRKADGRVVQLTFEKPDDFVMWQGEWNMVSAQRNGKDLARPHIEGNRMTIDGASIDVYSNADRSENDQPPEHSFLSIDGCTLELEPNATPPRFTIRRNGEKEPFCFGLYQLTGDQHGTELRVSTSTSGYPGRMESAGSGAGDVAVFRRLSETQ